MKWIELTVDVPPEYAEPMSEIFHRYGHGGVAIEQEAGYNPDEGESPPVPDFVTIKTYLPEDCLLYTSDAADDPLRIDHHQDRNNHINK